MKIVQIKGANGSGKTTIIKQMLAQCSNPRYHKWADGRANPTVYATSMPEIGWVAVGKYDARSKMGGCDRLPSVQMIKDAIVDSVLLALRLERERARYRCGVVFEGMMISTIKSTFYNFLLEQQAERGIEPLFVILQATPEGCIQRISNRGTMRKNLNHDNIRAKCAMVIRHAKTYDPQYVRWMDVETIPEANMLKQFLTLVSNG